MLTFTRIVGGLVAFMRQAVARPYGVLRHRRFREAVRREPEARLGFFRQPLQFQWGLAAVALLAVSTQSNLLAVLGLMAGPARLAPQPDLQVWDLRPWLVVGLVLPAVIPPMRRFAQRMLARTASGLLPSTDGRR